MIRKVLITVLLVASASLIAKSQDKDASFKPFNKIVLDLGAVPMSITNTDDMQFYAYSLALGYQFNDRIDIRINVDQFNFSYQNYEFMSERYSAERLIGLSIGSNVTVFRPKKDSFFANSTLGLVGKFGAGISPKYKEQESLFGDLSLRANIGKVPYFGLGVNYQFYGNTYKENHIGLYFTFGLNI